MAEYEIFQDEIGYTAPPAEYENGCYDKIRAFRENYIIADQLRKKGAQYKRENIKDNRKDHRCKALPNHL